jgi:hypothetical protein
MVRMRVPVAELRLGLSPRPNEKQPRLLYYELVSHSLRRVIQRLWLSFTHRSCADPSLAHSEVEYHGSNNAAHAFWVKPFTQPDLARKIRSAIYRYTAVTQ